MGHKSHSDLREQITEWIADKFGYDVYVQHLPYSRASIFFLDSKEDVALMKLTWG